jgi:hypothetical protein
VVSPASSTFFFYFISESFFATLKQKWDFFCYPVAKKTRVSMGIRRLGNQIPRGIPSTVLYLKGTNGNLVGHRWRATYTLTNNVLLGMSCVLVCFVYYVYICVVYFVQRLVCKYVLCIGK